MEDRLFPVASGEMVKTALKYRIPEFSVSFVWFAAIYDTYKIMKMSLKCCTESFRTWTIWIALAFIKWEKINGIKGFVIKMNLKSCKNEACLCHPRKKPEAVFKSELLQN